MATAKTPKSTSAAPATAAKPAQDAVVHSAEIVTQAAAEAAPEVPPAAARPAAKAVIAAKPAKGEEEAALKSVETFLEFGRDNAILLVSAGNELALGLHKLSQSLIDWSAESCDKSVAGASAILSAKTVEEMVELSQSLAKDGLQQLLKESAELGSLSTRLFESTIVPLPGRLAATVEKLAAQAA